MSGRLSVDEAAEQSQKVVRRRFQYIEPSAARSVQEILPDIVESEAEIGVESEEEAELGPMPPFIREISTEAKLLTIEDDQPAVKGYRCFLALAESTRLGNGRALLQPHSTSIVWGGQRALFVFQHHSGRFGLYYDLQASDIISPTSGGGACPTCTIVVENQIFIPIPEAIRKSFIPGAGERKRFEFRDDLLYIEDADMAEGGADATPATGYGASDG